MRRCFPKPILFQKQLLSGHIRQWYPATWRPYSSAPAVMGQTEVKVQMRVGSSGTISLEYLSYVAKAKVAQLITQSSIRSPPIPSSHSPVIIYLPRGPVMASGPDLLPSLALGANATVVRLNYRLSNQYPYPTPIHDVLAGYDWIKSHLGHDTDVSGDIRQVIQARKLGICGELIGGSLAGMVAVTECHTDQQGISAAVLGNPISDWTALFPPDQHTDRSEPTALPQHIAKKPTTSNVKSHDGPTIGSLLSLRDTIFPQPAKFFDPFASPSLFFCTPGFDLPPAVNLLLAEEASSSELPSSPFDLPVVRKRRYHRIHPPLNVDLRLPRTRVELGKASVLRDQGIEFVELMRRSVTLREREEPTGVDSAGKFELLDRGGTGLWCEKVAGDVGRWLGEALRS
jgi:acetyl esterase/lipase